VEANERQTRAEPGGAPQSGTTGGQVGRPGKDNGQTSDAEETLLLVLSPSNGLRWRHVSGPTNVDVSGVRADLRQPTNHTCAVLTNLERHFAGKAPVVEPHSTGSWRWCRIRPGEVAEDKDRAARAVSFAAFTPRRDWLGHLVLARRIDSPRFAGWRRSRRATSCTFRLTVGRRRREFAGWLEAYQVGQQRRLRA
jgi:hypothetical protein